MLKDFDIHTNLPGGNTHLKCRRDHIVTANYLTHKPSKTVTQFPPFFTVKLFLSSRATCSTIRIIQNDSHHWSNQKQ